MFLFEPIRARCHASSAAGVCRLRLSEVAGFDWDRVAFIRMHASMQQAARALGVAALPKPEFEDWIVFVKGSQVTRIDRRSYDPDKPFLDTVFLDFAGTSEGWLILTRDADQVELSAASDPRNLLLRLVPPAATPSRPPPA